MSIPERIAALIGSRAGEAGFSMQESSGKLFCHGAWSIHQLTEWRLLVTECSKVDWIEISCLDNIDDTFDFLAGNISDIANTKIRIVIKTSEFAGAVHLYSNVGFNSFLQDPDCLSTKSVVRLAGLGRSFSSESVEFVEWKGCPGPAAENKSSSECNPRRFVRVIDTDIRPPQDIEPWLLREKPDHQNDAFYVWRQMSGVYLIRVFANELYKDDGREFALLAGQSLKRIPFGQLVDMDDIHWDAVQAAARWIFLGGTPGARDVEVRHTFFANELARGWPDGLKYAPGIGTRLQSALESARLLYKAHLKSGAKDTLKALADLRKTLADEVQKLAQQTRDLATAVWRDVAVAIGVVAVRYSLDATTKNKTNDGFSIIFIIVAIYLASSFCMTLRTNAEFMNVSNEIMKSWKSKLYAFMDSDDFKQLAEEPIEKATAAYHIARVRAIVVVSIVVLILTGLAIQEAGLLTL